MKRTILLSLILSLFIGLHAGATESLESNDVHLMIDKAHELTAKYDKAEVLLVYDIDNTLLTANQDLGGDAWFNWQAAKIQSGDLKDTVAQDMNGLIDAQSTIFSYGKMHAVDAEGPGVFNRLQHEGYSTLLLTSRGTNNRDATVRELSRNGYDLSIRPLADHGIAGQFIPYDIQHPEESGLTQQEIKALGLGPARSVTIVDGLYMTSGQHKGAMLQTLINRLHRTFRAVLFIDDTPKNLTRMHDALDSVGIDVVTIRYSKLDTEVQRFDRGDKAQVITAWEQLKNTLSSVFH
ncbi:MAG: DUF2608 domain-containing protein [Bdellovibrionales bacterium]